jgi:hypothetical protein
VGVARLCVNCGKRWQQSRLRLCRTCERLLSADLRRVLERDCAWLEDERVAQIATERKVVVVRPSREIVVDGTVWEVMWDGAIR